MKKTIKFKRMLLIGGLLGATTICGAVALSSCTFGISNAIKNPNNNSSNDLINPDLNNNVNINKPATPTLAIGIDSNPEIYKQSNYATITLKSNQSTTSINKEKISTSSAEKTSSFTFSIENSSNSEYGKFSFVTSNVEDDTNSTGSDASFNSTNQEFVTTKSTETENNSITLDFSQDPSKPKTLSLKFTKATNSNYNIANISIQSSLDSSTTLTVTKKAITNDGSSMLLDITLPAYNLSDSEVNPFYSSSNSLNISAVFLENQKENWNVLSNTNSNISNLSYFSVNNSTYTFDDVKNHNLKLIGSSDLSKPNQYCIFLNGNHLKIENMTIPAGVQLYFIGNSLPNEVDTSTISKASSNSIISKNSNSYVAAVGNVSWSN